MNMHRAITRNFTLLLLLSASGCRPAAKPVPNSPELKADNAPSVQIQVRDSSSDLRFFWFDPAGNAHMVASVSEVPPEARDRVRVDPLDSQLRPAGWVYVTDLRKAQADGTYPVRLVTTDTLVAELPQAPRPTDQPAAAVGSLANAPGSGAPNDGQRVVIYGASWCSACHQAAAYMRGHNIPFIERDIEREPDAAQELMRRAQEQGVPTGSIPIIDVRGRLMVGFSPGALEQALRGT